MNGEWLGPMGEKSRQVEELDRLSSRNAALEAENAELKARIANGLEEVARLNRAGYSITALVRSALQGEP
jgi:cell division protein FtsB